MTSEVEEYTCEDCGADAYDLRPCPFNEGMGGLTHLVWLCDDCYQAREYEL